jgi:hypothetical protein
VAEFEKGEMGRGSSNGSPRLDLHLAQAERRESIVMGEVHPFLLNSSGAFSQPHIPYNPPLCNQHHLNS